MIQITKNLTNVNFTKMSNKINKYIVIHYVGAVSTAKANSEYFKNENRNASANYFVDDDSIYQVVEDSNRAWHCGGKLQGNNGHTFYQICINSNSIGIEMCCKKDNKGQLYISDKTLENTADLVQYLMNKYNISSENVIRHYDVTGKLCPEMYIDEIEWKKLHKKLTTSEDITAAETKKTYYKVKSGDTLTKIAKKYGVTVKKLAKWNNIQDINTIFVGQKLRIK